MGDKKNKQNRVSTISLAVKNQSFIKKIEKIHGKITPRKGKNPILSEGRDEDENFGPLCPGCGVFMQDKDPNLLRYYQKRKVIERKVVENEDGDEMTYWSILRMNLKGWMMTLKKKGIF